MDSPQADNGNFGAPLLCTNQNSNPTIPLPGWISPIAIPFVRRSTSALSFSATMIVIPMPMLKT